LISLKGAPKEVGGNIYLHHNKLVTLKGLGKIHGNIKCDDNPKSQADLLKTI
jgi:hypothetical protein